MADPIRPPNRACEDEEGRPSSQVVRFHRMPPTRPANTMVRIGIPISDSTGAPLLSWIEMILLLTVRATSMERKAPTRLSTAERMTAFLGLQSAGGDGGGHRVTGVVEAVGEVERQCGHDDHDEDEQRFGHRDNGAAEKPLTIQPGVDIRGLVHQLFMLVTLTRTCRVAQVTGPPYQRHGFG